MPSKPNKYDIKFWILCDADSAYACNIQYYTGRPIGGAPEKKPRNACRFGSNPGSPRIQYYLPQFFYFVSIGPEAPGTQTNDAWNFAQKKGKFHWNFSTIKSQFIPQLLRSRKTLRLFHTFPRNTRM